MRHEKAEQLVRLSMMMVGSTVGVGLEEIQETFAVGRRTAERMRDAVIRLLPDVDELRDDDGRKRWRATQMPANIPTVSADDIAVLHNVARGLEGSNREHQARTLLKLADTLLAVQKAATRRRIAPDLELLMQAEGVAHRVGPVIEINPDILNSVRTAILASTVLRLSYQARGKAKPQEIDVEPYGILYGARPYLVGKGLGMPDFRHFRLNGISGIVTTDTPFVRDPGFNLGEYRAQFFGSFREPPVDNVWRFKPEVADIAAEYVFHPKQTSERLDDGSLVVSFRAGGQQEMAWHLATWGDNVEVLEPAKNNPASG